MKKINMTNQILIDALYVSSGGGLHLLKYLTSELDKKGIDYFLLADDRTSSVDSRIYGPVTKERIGGKAFLRYFPLSSFSTL